MRRRPPAREANAKTCDILPAPLDSLVSPDVITETYHMVALPKHGGPVRFVRHDLRVRCDAPKAGTLDVSEPLGLVMSGKASPKTIRKNARERDREVKAVRDAVRLTDR